MLRQETLETLALTLKNLNDDKIDFVAPASHITSRDGVLEVRNAVPEITPDGVTNRTAQFEPNRVMLEGIASKLDIPLAYTRRMHEHRRDLFDENVNGWLHGPSYVYGKPADHPGSDPRSFLIRGYKSHTEAWTGRAFLSQSYKMIEHLDAIAAALGGIAEAGIDVNVTSCDLTERRMYVHVDAPGIKVLAPELLGTYRSVLHGGGSAIDDPGITAGFVISNSEVGEGAFTITPRFTVLVCRNGMKRTKDAVRAVHLGERLSDGVIRWSDETQQRTLDLIKSKARDAVTTFLDVDYMQSVISEVAEQAQVALTKPEAVIQHVAKKLSYSDETIDGVLSHFIQGGSMTAGGVMQAVTSYAQTVQDADQAASLEDGAFRALELAATR